MEYYKSRKGTGVRIFTLVLILSVLAMIVLSYYHKVIKERDRLTAKRLEQSISLVLAKYVGVDLTYDNGRIYWTKENSDIIKDGILTVTGQEVVPFPDEKGYYYYMYLESPHTIIKLPYRIEGSPEIDDEVVNEDYMKKQYPKGEYRQVNEEVPLLKREYEVIRNSVQPKNQIVCLNT